MKQSQLFTKVIRENPADEVAKNAQLLIRGGYINKELAGVYDYLPLGLRVIEKIKQIVREEMNAISGQELFASTIQRKELWERTSRWDDEVVDVWFKSELKAGGEIGLGWSHEEPLADLMKKYLGSYRDLPKLVYQFQNKLRNELRAKSGIMRGREFLMKDAYSFSATEEQHNEIYEAHKQAYTNVFERLGLGSDTYITFAAGGAFTQFSHEFQTVCEAGEDVTYLCREKGIAINEEVLAAADLEELGVTREELIPTKTAEVGNIFNFGRDKAEGVGLYFTNEAGEQTAVWMGSYGIGITRVMGVVIEKFATEKALNWPENIAPFKVHLLSLGENEEVTQKSEELYQKLIKAGVEVLFDDRQTSAGEKFAEADFHSLPWRVVVSERSLAAGGMEVTHSKGEAAEILDLETTLHKLTS